MKRKRLQTEYLPLRFVNTGRRFAPGEAFSAVSEEFRTVDALPECLSEDELVKFMASPNFLSPFYDGKFKSLNRLLMLNAEYIKMQVGIGSSIGNNKTELKDVYLFPILSDRWMRYKQVYRIDETFANALLDTDNLALSRDVLRRLPYKDFYVDFEKCKNFAPIKGAFVHIMDISEGVAECGVFLITDELYFFSQYLSLVFDKNGIMVDNAKNHNDYTPYLTMGGEDISNRNAEQVVRPRIAFFILQLLSYLTSKEPDIVRDPTATCTKPYVPGARIRNKFSEITRQDIGVRIGNRIRVSIKEMSEAKKRAHTAVQHGGTPKIPHVRAAHWSHYWTGKGRTVYETRWIEPCFVNCSAEGSGQNIVIHDLEK